MPEKATENLNEIEETKRENIQMTEFQFLFSLIYLVEGVAEVS